MLSVDGDADVAVEVRIQIGWNKFRQLVPLLTNRDILYIIFPIVCLYALTLYPARADCAAVTDISGVTGCWQLSR